jgi:hypothetical protein
MEQVEFFVGNTATPQRAGVGDLDTTRDPIIQWRSWIKSLLSCSDEELASYDIAELNLLCALGLPGAEDLDVASCIRKLDYTAQLVRRNTEIWRPRMGHFPDSCGHRAGTDGAPACGSALVGAVGKNGTGNPLAAFGPPENPQGYDYSYAHFCMAALVTVLQVQLGVRYNLPFNEGDYNGTDSRNLLIHGILTGYGGTCITMPVLYIAVGRRLGYPLKLAEAREHAFVRWDDPRGVRFNIEATTEGYSPRDDEHYKTWPKPLTADLLGTGIFLKSLTPRQELSVFLRERAFCLRDNLQLAASLESLYYASLLYPDDLRSTQDRAVGTMMLEIVENIKRTGQSHGAINVSRSAPQDQWKNWAFPIADQELKRIFNIHRQKRARQDMPPK